MPSSSSSETPSSASRRTSTTVASRSRSSLLTRPSEHDPRAAFDLHFHIAIVGNVGVGKTSFLKSEVQSQLRQNPDAVLKSTPADFPGIHFTSCFYKESLKILGDFDDEDDEDGGESSEYRIKVTYWDVPGDQDSLELSCSLASAVAGIVYIADVSNPITFEDLTVWMLGIEKYEPIPKIIVGNKCDLKYAVPETMSVKKGIAFAEKLNAFYYEASSLNDVGVSHSLSLLRTEILQKVKNKKVLQLRNHIFQNRIEIGETLLGRHARLPRVQAPLPADCTM